MSASVDALTLARDAIVAVAKAANATLDRIERSRLTDPSAAGRRARQLFQADSAIIHELLACAQRLEHHLATHHVDDGAAP